MWGRFPKPFPLESELSVIRSHECSYAHTSPSICKAFGAQFVWKSQMWSHECSYAHIGFSLLGHNWHTKWMFTSISNKLYLMNVRTRTLGSHFLAQIMGPKQIQFKPPNWISWMLVRAHWCLICWYNFSNKMEIHIWDHMIFPLGVGVQKPWSLDLDSIILTRECIDRRKKFIR